VKGLIADPVTKAHQIDVEAVQGHRSDLNGFVDHLGEQRSVRPRWQKSTKGVTAGSQQPRPSARTAVPSGSVSAAMTLPSPRR
jgi:hypothetical protein